ncbi:DUF3592 domain-containing protein [Amycolatopsis magusensis]|uniref:DUF3592 domain-containing protein n=1 Tax=Amycolatopsis magusensis TaxID=882444 RepID=A0ABS4PLH9_9PSEU|nr:DUF3592 domain-containing protein [Amycolatopsis magusensis]MBP2180282.1 hypothetical protein [Amycolatopsis magusensis]
MSPRSEKLLRIGVRVLVGVAAVLTLLCVTLFFAAVRNDSAIADHRGTADAEVLSVSFDRTLIRFVTPDGVAHTPSLGVLYPAGLEAGQLVRVEYNSEDPELARVAGRTASLTLLPLGTTILFTWLVAGPAWFFARRLLPRPTPAASSRATSDPRPTAADPAEPPAHQDK